MALTKAHTRMIEGDAISVLDYGATGDGVTDDTAAIQAAIDATTNNNVFFPPATYAVASTIDLPSGVILRGDRQAFLKPLSSSFTMLASDTAFTSSLFIDGIGFTGTGTGQTNVTAINITSSGIGVILNNLSFTDIDTGLDLTTNYGTKIENPKAFRVPNPIKLNSGGVYQILFPSFDNSVGVAAGDGTGNGILAAGQCQVIGGYIQGYEYGINDTGRRSAYDGVYFESCSEAALYFNGAAYPTVENCHFFGFDGKSYIKCRSTDNGHFSRNHMTTSTATLGFYDVDTSNTDCVGMLDYVDSTHNNDSGDTSGLLPLGNQSGAYKDGLHLKGTFTADTSTQVFTIIAPDYSTTSCEITVQGIEKTAYYASASKKFRFNIHRVTSVTNSSVVEISDFDYSRSSGTYSITPSVSLSTDASGDTVVSVTLTSGGSVGFAQASGSVSLKAENTSNRISVNPLL
jgi:hypothetical protein